MTAWLRTSSRTNRVNLRAIQTSYIDHIQLSTAYICHQAEIVSVNQSIYLLMGSAVVADDGDADHTAAGRITLTSLAGVVRRALYCCSDITGIAAAAWCRESVAADAVVIKRQQTPKLFLCRRCASRLIQLPLKAWVVEAKRAQNTCEGRALTVQGSILQQLSRLGLLLVEIVVALIGISHHWRRVTLAHQRQ